MSGGLFMVPTKGVFVGEILFMGWGTSVLHSDYQAVCMALFGLMLEAAACHLLSFLLFSMLPFA
jgi:hypothetical protein